MVRSAATPRVSNHAAMGSKKNGGHPDGRPLFDAIDAAVVLLDDLDDPMGARIDQNRTVVHDRVTIIAGAVFRRHLIIGDAFLRQDRANSDVLAILIGGATLLGDVTVKTGTLIDAQNPGDSTDHAANDAADNGTDRAGGSLAISRASLNSTRDTLGLGGDRQRDGCDKRSNSDKTADHDFS
jgi:hypothetical protein